MKNAKCTNCGATIEVDEKQSAGICKYCNSAYVTEKAIEQYNNSVSNIATNNAQTIVNNYYNAAEAKSNVVQIVEPRPKLKVGLAIFLCCLYFFPGVLYIASVKKKQREWDKTYRR